MNKWKYSNTKLIFFWLINIIFIIEWIFLAFDVQSREDWLLENILVFLLIGPAAWFFIKGYISKTSYVLLFIFLSFHSIGAHYTYSFVPYDAWFNKIFGVSLNLLFSWQRNNYDRFLHFLWGLLLYRPLYEVFKSSFNLQTTVLNLFTLFALITFSTMYEMIEWLAALVFGGDLGMAFVGAQGDMWDAQKDQTLALVGSLLAILLICLFEANANKNSRTHAIY